MKIYQKLAVICLFIWLAGPVYAQMGGHGGGMGGDCPMAGKMHGKGHGHHNKKMWKERHQMIKKVREKILNEKLGLKGEKLAAVKKIFAQTDEQFKTDKKEKHKIIKTLHQMVKEGKADDKQITSLIDKLLASKKKIHQLQHDQIVKIRQILSPQEQARFILSIPRIHKSIHRRMLIKRQKMLKRHLKEVDSQLEAEKEHK